MAAILAPDVVAVLAWVATVLQICLPPITYTPALPISARYPWADKAAGALSTRTHQPCRLFWGIGHFYLLISKVPLDLLEPLMERGLKLISTSPTNILPFSIYFKVPQFTRWAGGLAYAINTNRFQTCSLSTHMRVIRAAPHTACFAPQLHYMVPPD